jgi:hypothetical protein
VSVDGCLACEVIADGAAAFADRVRDALAGAEAGTFQ